MQYGGQHFCAIVQELGYIPFFDCLNCSLGLDGILKLWLFYYSLSFVELDMFVVEMCFRSDEYLLNDNQSRELS